jgi:putative iron-regulated protein
MQVRNLTLAIATLLSSATLIGLPAHAATPAASASSAAAVDANAVAGHYAELVYANYSDTLAAATDMQAAIAAFVKAPTAEGLEKARQAWRDAR